MARLKQVILMKDTLPVWSKDEAVNPKLSHPSSARPDHAGEVYLAKSFTAVVGQQGDLPL